MTSSECIGIVFFIDTLALQAKMYSTSPTPKRAKRGFSLVELSIVLVILGLLVGGVLSGQSLIRAAELRAVSTEYSRYVTAAASFRDKYFAIPGDMNNATSFWGASSSCPGTAGTGTQTCNGNGNGQLDGPAAASQYGEWFTFWQHLASAGMIEGNYTGIAGSGSASHSTRNNTPASKLSNSLWFVAWDSSSGAAMFPVNLTRHNLRLGGVHPTAFPDVNVLKTEEMWNIDTKLDDGRPASGTITAALASYKANCASTSVASTANYVLSESGINCTFYGALGL